MIFLDQPYNREIRVTSTSKEPYDLLQHIEVALFPHTEAKVFEEGKDLFPLPGVRLLYQLRTYQTPFIGVYTLLGVVRT